VGLGKSMRWEGEGGRGKGKGRAVAAGKLTSAAASKDTGDRSDRMAFEDSNGFQYGRQAVSWGGAWARVRARAMAMATGWDSEEGQSARAGAGAGAGAGAAIHPLLSVFSMRA
jgi:hypothetical protein